ncbi:MAG: hypothetical protein HC914_16035 [Chloroflexaceae bacterium]|nr:hypothetical protein [Chloroflexaceae bacterium]
MARDPRSSQEQSPDSQRQHTDQPLDEQSPEQQVSRQHLSERVGNLLDRIQADHVGAREAWSSLRERMLRRRAELQQAAARRTASPVEPPTPPAPPLQAAIPPFRPAAEASLELPAEQPDDQPTAEDTLSDLFLTAVPAAPAISAEPIAADDEQAAPNEDALAATEAALAAEPDHDTYADWFAAFGDMVVSSAAPASDETDLLLSNDEPPIPAPLEAPSTSQTDTRLLDEVEHLVSELQAEHSPADSPPVAEPAPLAEGPLPAPEPEPTPGPESEQTVLPPRRGVTDTAAYMSGSLLDTLDEIDLLLNMLDQPVGVTIPPPAPPEAAAPAAPPQAPPPDDPFESVVGADPLEALAFDDLFDPVDEDTARERPEHPASTTSSPDPFDEISRLLTKLEQTVQPSSYPEDAPPAPVPVAGAEPPDSPVSPEPLPPATIDEAEAFAEIEALIASMDTDINTDREPILTPAIAPVPPAPVAPAPMIAQVSAPSRSAPSDIFNEVDALIDELRDLVQALPATAALPTPPAVPHPPPADVDDLAALEALLATIEHDRAVPTQHPTNQEIVPPTHNAPLPLLRQHNQERIPRTAVLPVSSTLGNLLEEVLDTTLLPQRRLKQVGNTAYVYLTRIGIGVRQLERTAEDITEQQRQQLSAALAQIQQHIMALLTELERAYRETDPTRRRNLADYVEILGRNLGMLRQELDMTERQAEAHRLYMLSTYAGEMHRQIGDLLQDLRAAYQTIIMEPWRSILGEQARQRPTRHIIGPGSGSNDLTRIHGIGAGIQQRLNQIGIYTYTELARSSPEQLRSAMGTIAGLVNVEDWIIQARRLSGQH